KTSSNIVPEHIDQNLVESIKVLWGRFAIPFWVIYPRVFLVSAILLIAFELFWSGGNLLPSARFIGFLINAVICAFPISQVIHILFRIEVNEYGFKCYNRFGGTWFIEWDKIEKVEAGSYLGVNLIRIKPADNTTTFAIPKCLRDYEMFKALCYQSIKDKHHP